MNYSNSVFDILTPVEFLYSIEQSFEKYKAEKQRNIASLLYVVMGLTHLREWIAPGYQCKGKCKKAPRNDEEKFSKKRFFLREDFGGKECCSLHFKSLPHHDSFFFHIWDCNGKL